MRLKLALAECPSETPITIRRPRHDEAVTVETGLVVGYE